MTADHKCFFLVDGGGSKTHARLTTASGEILTEAFGGPSNLSTDFDAAKAEILTLTEKLYASCNRTAEQAANDCALIGLAGAGASVQRDELIAALPFNNCQIVTDIDLTVAAAFGESGDGVVAMLGTGSFFVWREKGQVKRVGGWGFELGDECGGAWLGRELLRQTIAAYDGLCPHSPLTECTLAEFGGTPKQMVRFAKTKGAREFARLASQIFEVAQNKDPNAKVIIERAVAQITKTLGPAESFPGNRLVMLGGLAALYRPHLPGSYKDVLERAKGEPLDGAYLLAKAKFKTS